MCIRDSLKEAKESNKDFAGCPIGNMDVQGEDATKSYSPVRCNKDVYKRQAFDKAVINLPEEKTFSIVVKNNEKKNKYIESVTLNGQPLNLSLIHI